MAYRIKKVINKIINADQTGYIKNRFTGFNLRQIQDIIDYADKFNVEGAILFIDFSKAFDTLSWNFMYQTLQHFGFNNSFISWVKTLYTEINSSVINNGWISAPVRLQRGIRQGCPCSSIIFVIAVEIMANRLRYNNNIKGIEIKLNGKTHNLKISQLADDTTLFLKSKEEINIALNIIEIFGSFSGLKLNKNKTEGIWIGKLKHCKDKIDNINFRDKPVKVLGLYFGIISKECDKLNWETKLEKTKNLMTSWEKRNLSLLGKILIVKTLIIPQFTYIASSTVLNKTHIDLLEKEIFKFIWSGKNDRVKRNTLIAKYEKGGLNMMDIKSHFSTLKVKWVSRLLESSTENWAIIPKLFFNKYGEHFLIFKMNLGIQNLKYLHNIQEIPHFYQEILKCWLQIGGGETKTPNDFRKIRSEIIWGNKNIKFKNKPVIMLNWINSNLLYINDIIDENGEISENYILNKLKLKNNWIAELSILKQAIPKEWQNILKTESSVKTKVNINKNANHTIRINKSYVQIRKLKNKTIYNSFISIKVEKNIGVEKWKRILDTDSKEIIQAFEFIHYRLSLNKLKVYRWKLISCILPNQENLYKWKISSTPKCTLCNHVDSYQHFFMECNLLLNFWQSVSEIFGKIGITNKIKLKHIVIGYKIYDMEYDHINLILTILGFTIYKAFYVSELRRKSVDYMKIFKAEFNSYFEHITQFKVNRNKMICKFYKALKDY